MLQHLRPAVSLLALLTLVTGVAYPLAVTGAAQLLLPAQANGGLIEKDGKLIGSALIGQNFADARYFHGRPSATSAPDPADAARTVDAPYNAASSGAANLGPTSRKLIDRIKADADAMKAAGHATPLPADALTTSAPVAAGRLAPPPPGPGPPHAARQCGGAGAGRGEGARPAARTRDGAGRGADARPDAGRFRRAARQRAGAQHGAGCAKVSVNGDAA